ncbi:MAG: hypothetical protein KDK71_09405, partial [Chlamydiia bacterium]|nr:hypothetical protein [Chlamydiia bacterium]
MASPASLNIQERYNRLLPLVNADGADLTEGHELHRLAVSLFYEATHQDTSLGHECGCLLNRFTPVRPELPERVDPNAVETKFGTINQYQKIEFDRDGNPLRILEETEADSSCTSCAHEFLRSVLSMGLAWDITPEQLTDYVVMGKGLHNVLQKQVRFLANEDLEKLTQSMLPAEAKALRENFVIHQAFSTPEINEKYGLGIAGDPFPLGGNETKILTENVSPFFDGLMKHLEDAMLSHGHQRIGATIHHAGKTYALALFDTVRGREYVFFDSHGRGDLHGGNSSAFVKYTFNRTEMVRFLCTMMPYTPLDVEASTAESLSADQRAGILRETNAFICYVMDLNEQGILGVTPPQSPPGSPDPLGMSSFVDLTSVDEGTPVPTTLDSPPPSGSEVVSIDRTEGLGASSFVMVPGTEPQPPVTSQLESGMSPGEGSGEGGGSESPSRIHHYAIGLFILIVAAAAYKYRKPIMQQITSFTTKFGRSSAGEKKINKL